jgi:hypothetical protein
MLELIGGWLMKSALMTSPAGSVILGAGKLLKKTPWQVWAAIGIALALWVGVKWHKHEVHKTWQAGYNQAVADIRAAEAKKIAPLKQLKTTGDAKNVAVNEGVKKVHDAQTSHIDSNLADLLGVLERPPGGAGSDPGRGVSDAAGSAGPGRAQAPVDDGLAQELAAQSGGASDVLIAVPAKQLYVRSAQCDRDYVALTAWEDAYGGWYRNYQDWLAATKKVAKPTH